MAKTGGSETRPYERCGVEAYEEISGAMNRAFLVIGIPAFTTSVMWFLFAYGWRMAIPLTILELAVIIGGVIYVRRRYSAAPRE